jgi:hypothetical protein
VGLKAKYTPQDIAIYLSHVFQNIEKSVIAVFKQDGKEFVDKAKAMTAQEGSFNNRTWNLRSSIGYYIFAGPKLVDSYFEGNAAGKAASDEAVARIPRINGYQLIGIAGMFYAIYVESKGYNVISTQTNMAFVNIRTHLSQVAKAR